MAILHSDQSNPWNPVGRSLQSNVPLTLYCLRPWAGGQAKSTAHAGPLTRPTTPLGIRPRAPPRGRSVRSRSR